MYCVNPHGPSKAACTTMNGWLGSRWAGNSVWSPPSIRETEKGTFNPVGSLRCHRQKEMHSFSFFSHLFHEDWRKRRGKTRREESNGEEGGGGWRKNYNWCIKKWITRQTHHRGRSSAPRATRSARLCSIANVDIVLFRACESVTMQMRRKQIFMTTFWGPRVCVCV